jgi:hypothetical protein
LTPYSSNAHGEADKGSDIDLLLLSDGEIHQTCELLDAEDAGGLFSLRSGYVLPLLRSTQSYALPQNCRFSGACGGGALLARAVLDNLRLLPCEPQDHRGEPGGGGEHEDCRAQPGGVEHRGYPASGEESEEHAGEQLQG